MVFFSKELLIQPYKPNTVIGEWTSTPSSPIYIKGNGVYQITAVSGGSGGSYYDTGYAYWMFSSGAAGGYYNGTVRLTAGNYYINVGGASGGGYHSSGAGGETNIIKNSTTIFKIAGANGSTVGGSVGGGWIDTVTNEVWRDSASGSGAESVTSGMVEYAWTTGTRGGTTINGTLYGFGGDVHYDWGVSWSLAGAGGGGYLRIIYKGLY